MEYWRISNQFSEGRKKWNVAGEWEYQLACQHFPLRLELFRYHEFECPFHSIHDFRNGPKSGKIDWNTLFGSNFWSSLLKESITEDGRSDAKIGWAENRCNRSENLIQDNLVLLISQQLFFSFKKFRLPRILIVQVNFPLWKEIFEEFHFKPDGRKHNRS